MSAPATNDLFSDPVIIADLMLVFELIEVIQSDNSLIVSLFNEFKNFGLFIVIKHVFSET